MAPWDRFRTRRIEARTERLPTRIASAQPLIDAPALLLRGSATRQPWQDQARLYSRTLGVVRFANSLTASVVSRCKPIAEYLVDPATDQWETRDDPIANSVIRTYKNSRDSTQELVWRHVWQRQTVGECLAAVEQRGAGVEWFIYATHATEIFDGRPVLVRDIPGGSVFNGGAHEVPLEQVTRFWVPDPDYALLATSPMEAIIDDCDRYTLLGRRTKREAKSALGLNGLVFTPESAHDYPPGPDGKPTLYSTLDRNMSAIASKSWDDDDSLAALAPFSVHYGTNADTAVKPEWIKIGQPLDPNMLDHRQEALECIVRGLPLPNIIGIEGTAGAESNHWNAWLISEDHFKTAAAPEADAVYHGDLTKAFFRPSLRQLARSGLWQGDPDRWRMGYDATPVIIHPDKAGRAVELYKLGAIKRDAVLLETGFSPSDSQDEAEHAQWIADQVAIRSVKGTSSDLAGTTEGPPAAATAALAPYPSEAGGWMLDSDGWLVDA